MKEEEEEEEEEKEEEEIALWHVWLCFLVTGITFSILHVLVAPLLMETCR